jgi:tRNA threonylcarbamoyladenosine biosynthesis protein TsaB
MSVLSQSAQGKIKLLALDTACAACSAALWIDGVVVSSRRREMVRGQAEALMPMVAEVMQDAQADFAALDLIAVTIGPGSFTGLRTGLAAARGLALARSLPLIGVTTTESIALAAHRLAPDSNLGRPITVVLNSRRADLYVQHFTAELTPIGGPFTALPQEIVRAVPGSGVLYAGDATDQIMDIVQAGSYSPDLSCFPVSASDATYVAEVAANRWSSRSVTETSFPDKLLYLRAPEAIRPAEQGRLRQ